MRQGDALFTFCPGSGIDSIDDCDGSAALDGDREEGTPAPAAVVKRTPAPVVVAQRTPAPTDTITDLLPLSPDRCVVRVAPPLLFFATGCLFLSRIDSLSVMLVDESSRTFFFFFWNIPGGDSLFSSSWSSFFFQ